MNNCSGPPTIRTIRVPGESRLTTIGEADQNVHFQPVLLPLELM